MSWLFLFLLLLLPVGGFGDRMSWLAWNTGNRERCLASLQSTRHPQLLFRSQALPYHHHADSFVSSLVVLGGGSTFKRWGLAEEERVAGGLKVILALWPPPHSISFPGPRVSGIVTMLPPSCEASAQVQKQLRPIDCGLKPPNPESKQAFPVCKLVISGIRYNGRKPITTQLHDHFLPCNPFGDGLFPGPLGSAAPLV